MNPPETYRDDDEGLAQLTTDLRAERPEVDPEFAAQLDAWAAAGFPRAERPGRTATPGAFERLRARVSATPPKKLLAPVGAMATASCSSSGWWSRSAPSPRARTSRRRSRRTDAGGEAARDQPPRSRTRQPTAARPGGYAAGGACQARPAEQAVTFGFNRDSLRRPPTSVAPDQRKVATHGRPRARQRARRGARRVRRGQRGRQPLPRDRGLVVGAERRRGRQGPRIELPAAHPRRATSRPRWPTSRNSRTCSRAPSATEDITGKFLSAQERIDELEASRESVLNQLAEADTEEEADALRRQLQSLNAQLSAVRAELEDARQRVQLVPVSVSIVAEEGAGDDGDWGDRRGARRRGPGPLDRRRGRPGRGRGAAAAGPDRPPGGPGAAHPHRPRPRARAGRVARGCG